MDSRFCSALVLLSVCLLHLSDAAPQEVRPAKCIHPEIIANGAAQCMEQVEQYQDCDAMMNALQCLSPLIDGCRAYELAEMHFWNNYLSFQDQVNKYCI